MGKDDEVLRKPRGKKVKIAKPKNFTDRAQKRIIPEQILEILTHILNERRFRNAPIEVHDVFQEVKAIVPTRGYTELIKQEIDQFKTPRLVRQETRAENKFHRETAKLEAADEPRQNRFKRPPKKHEIVEVQEADY